MATAFTTTHTHDYRWPTSGCLVPRAEAPNGHCEVKPGECGHNPPSPPPRTESRVCKDEALEERPWCQRGPLVPRVIGRVNPAPDRPRVKPPGCPAEPLPQASPWCDGDQVQPEVISARVGAAPQQDISRYDQPNQYLRKLCDKFPRPTAVVAATPRDELMRRVYADRYRTTYQSDFCKNSDDTSRQIGECDLTNAYQETKLIERPDVVEYADCKCGCGCRVARVMSRQSTEEPRLRPLACRPAAISHNVHFSCCSPKKTANTVGEEVGPPEKIPAWASEYTDSIGRIGQLIIDQKLLHPKKKKKRF